MPRPKGFSPVGIYTRDKQIRIPAAAEAYIQAAVWAWEVAEVRCEVAQLHKALREYIRQAKAPSKAMQKRQKAATKAKSKKSPATRKTAGIKEHSVQNEEIVSS